VGRTCAIVAPIETARHPKQLDAPVESILARNEAVLGWMPWRERVWRAIPGLLALLAVTTAMAAQALKPPPTTEAGIEAVQGKVELLRAGTQTWYTARTNQTLRAGDRIRTGLRSRVQLRFSDLSVGIVKEASDVEMRADESRPGGQLLFLGSGAFRFESRERAGELPVLGPTAACASRGTQFQFEVEPATGRATLTVLDGEVELSNDQGRRVVQAGEQGTAGRGQQPTLRRVLEPMNVIQWSLYYPAVLVPSDAKLPDADTAVLAGSLASYRGGDLAAALEQYPAGRQPGSDPERAYLAALLLTVGSVTEADSLLSQIKSDGPAADLAVALRRLIAAVKLQDSPAAAEPKTASEWLAESYYQQSRGQLSKALEAARLAADLAPDAGFAWARVADLEFSFGRVARAKAAVTKALALAPRHAAAVVLRGFLASAENRIAQAQELFSQAISLDPALGPAWLGRGLCRIRSGDVVAGRKDLQMGAALEPHHALFHAYLGKALTGVGADHELAWKELALAMRLDPQEPTAWLYSALLHQQEGRINEGIRDLEHAQGLNDNRRVYRSPLLLDQDRAVKSANLAGLYRDAGMTDVSVREATHALEDDYANYSAHLFLANGYNELRDPRQVNLRFETPWFSEFLMANLLAPVGAGTLSQTVTQNEYSKLLERDRLGLSTRTEYYSRGDWVQAASQYGAFGTSAYALDAYYRSANGEAPNQDSRQLTLSAQVKQQLGPQDTIYLQAIGYDSHFGDVSQYYDPKSAHKRLRGDERQEPLLLGGWHHEWAPGAHTLLLVSRLQDEVNLTDPDSQVLKIGRNAARKVTGFSVLTNAAVTAHREFEAYSAECQQIWQPAHHTLILGARYQSGTFDTSSRIQEPTVVVLGLPVIPKPKDQQVSPGLERQSAYLYDRWRVWEPLTLTLGVAYDRLTEPVNYRLAPVSNSELTRDQVSPKAGLSLRLGKDAVLRGGYTRSLGGVSFDQSFRLEPVQVGGFNQTFRSLIPEAVQGSVAGQRFETGSVGYDHNFSTGSYLTLEGVWLSADADRYRGALATGVAPSPYDLTHQDLAFEERTASVALNQLVGNNWSFGARYRISEATLQSRYLELPALSSDQRAVLQQLSLQARYNCSCGFFGLFESLWTGQANHRGIAALPGDHFWQFNVALGYRFLQRHAEVSLAVLNLTAQDYRLYPLNLYNETYRGRTLALTAKFYF